MIRNLEASFPLVFFGVGCVAITVLLWAEHTHVAIGRIPLWLPFLAIGLIALAGATLSVFAEPDPEPPKAPAARPGPSPRRVPAGTRRPSGPRSLPAARTPPDIGRPIPAPRRTAAASPPPEAPPAPAPVAPAAALTDPGPFDSDATALLAELDQIDAALHGGRTSGSGRGAAPSPSSAPLPSTASAVSGGPPTSPAGPAAVGGEPPGGAEAPRMLAHCVGCGSAILHTGSPAQCQVCGEPLCSDCRDRSLAEGKPNLCPLCSLLDTVHAKGPPTRASARSTP